MPGWYLDVVVGYIIRLIIRAITGQQARTWFVERASVSAASWESIYGGPVAEVRYTYIYNGGYYSGVSRKPFILETSAEDYATQFPVGTTIAVRVDPQEPEASFFSEDDQTPGQLRI